MVVTGATKVARALATVRARAKDVHDVERAAKRVGRARDAAIVKAVAAGATQAAVAKAAGLSQGRVQQLAPRRPVPLAMNGGTQELLAEIFAPVVPEHPAAVELAADVELGSDRATSRSVRPYTERPTTWRYVSEARTPGELLGRLRSDVRGARVFLVGGLQGAMYGGASDSERARAWALDADLPDGWAVSESGHYLSDPEHPVCRWTHTDGRDVEVHRAASWFGEGDYTAAEAAEAWAELDTAVGRLFVNGRLLSTPATTGRDLWLRTIPEGKGYPVASAAVRELLAATAGQGRSELLPHTGKLDGLTYLDGRLMYAGLTWGMPVGVPERVHPLTSDGDQDRAAYLAKRGWWRVAAEVPAGWDHVGLLMAPAAGGGWRYPRTPGERFTTWASGAEVALAESNGWTCQLLDGLVWAEGKPLNTWTNKLIELYAATSNPLVRNAVRAMLLYGIGAFAARSHPVTRVSAEPPANPGGPVSRVGSVFVWDEPGTVSAWSEGMAHPEWSAQIWARARVRLLSADKGAAGALALPFERVVAFRTDAVYVTGGDPGWPDDGQVGRFRVKGSIEGPVWAPRNLAALFALRDEAEGNA